LTNHSESDPEFWTFRGNSIRQGSHGIFQYPAMMVPQLQGTLLDDLLKVDAEVKTIYDPFAGSGTVLVEAMLRGLNVVAADINPMALLLCAVKAQPTGKKSITRAIGRVVQEAMRSSEECNLNFAGIDKWFTRNAKTELFRLRVAIANEGSKPSKPESPGSRPRRTPRSSNSKTSPPTPTTPPPRPTAPGSAPGSPNSTTNANNSKPSSRPWPRPPRPPPTPNSWTGSRSRETSCPASPPGSKPDCSRPSASPSCGTNQPARPPSAPRSPTPPSAPSPPSWTPAKTTTTTPTPTP
jgi:hypothetical protein